MIAAAALAVFFGTNLVYQVLRKPTEVFSPVSGALNKSPVETWLRYGSLFREYSTASISPELLAALAQVEGAGNPVASTYWRWRLTWNPFAIYQPDSSSVGMYQMTDAASTRRGTTAKRRERPEANLRTCPVRCRPWVESQP